MSGKEEPTPVSLPGTVKHYERHLFICTGTVGWPTRIEAGGGFAQALSESLASFASVIPHKVKLTACDEPTIGRGNRADPGYDLLVYPEGIRYLGVRTVDFPALIEEHLVHGKVAVSLPHRQLTGWHVFVCVHGQRDERCGQCGPPVAARFQAEIAARNLSNRVTVRRTSHVGGHALAGNVLIYPGGDWFGYVTPADVPRLLDQHIRQGKPVADLWRGRMGLTPAEQIAQAEAWKASGSLQGSS